MPDCSARIRVASWSALISRLKKATPAEFEENFRQYGAQGYDLVFGHGFEFQDAAVRVAPQFPRTLYVTTSGNQVRENVAGMTFAFEEASYLAGLYFFGNAGRRCLPGGNIACTRQIQLADLFIQRHLLHQVADVSIHFGIGRCRLWFSSRCFPMLRRCTQ